MGDDYYIREADEYSEETHSDDLFQNSSKPKKESFKKKATDVTSIMHSAIEDK